MYKNFTKRILDFFISFVIIICLSPIFIIVTIWLQIANKGAGAFFTQLRPGKDEKPFKVIKYKTMTDERDGDGKLLPDAQRLTKIGKIVRSLSIDELPQFFNVLKGDMALIGPRPLLMSYLLVYNEKHKHRHDVRPGITGWAQVHGRNLLKLSKKFDYDVWYVEHCSFLLDCKIIWMTIIKVLKKDSVGDGAMDMEAVDDLNFSERLRKLETNNSK